MNCSKDNGDPRADSNCDVPLPIGSIRPSGGAAGSVRAKYLPFSPPHIGEEEIREVADTLRSGWITTGPKTSRFESEFAEFLSAPGALALNSCTAGLHIAIATLGVGPGDEVITTPMTFVSTVNVIEHCGARPVLVDVQPDTLNIDPEQVERAVSTRTKVILPVHFAGHPAALDALEQAARGMQVTVVEDAAHAIPASYKGRCIGSGPNPVAFSFYATKNMTTGEGGMLTGDPAFLERARELSLHGMSRGAHTRYEEGGSWQYGIAAPGFKYNMTDIQASLGIWQLKKLESFQRRRREIVKAYTDAFQREEAFELPVELPGVSHAWHLYVLRLNLEMLRIDRDAFVWELTRRNIGTSVHFIPIHIHSYYSNKYGFVPDSYPVAYHNFQRTVSLPLHPGLTVGDVGDVIAAVFDTLEGSRL